MIGFHLKNRLTILVHLYIAEVTPIVGSKTIEVAPRYTQQSKTFTIFKIVFRFQRFQWKC